MWSRLTAGGSSTTWTTVPALDAAAWPDAPASLQTYAWIPFSHTTDPSRGVDFVPRAESEHLRPYKASSTRPIVVWDVSTITAAAFGGEGRP